MTMKKFIPINVSSKFAICGLPIRVDTYKGCSHGCRYCFANERKIMEFKKTVSLGDLDWVERKLQKIFGGNSDPTNFLERLILEGITWHCGGMSDPFQPIEEEFQITKKLVDITSLFGISILFSTKGFSTYGVDLNPELHTFQFSITNIENRNDLEPFVANIEARYALYKTLKSRGFKCGIRVQPFIPGITKINIVEKFKDADYFTLEGLKLVPQNKEHKEYLLNLLGLQGSDFRQMGLLNLHPEIRKEMYREFIAELERFNVPYSLADNDFHHISSGACCCGDPLVKKSTTFNNTAMCKKYGTDYSKENLLDELQGIGDCVCNSLFTSNRQEGGFFDYFNERTCKTVREFYEQRFNRASSPFSPQFLYRKNEEVLF